MKLIAKLLILLALLSISVSGHGVKTLCGLPNGVEENENDVVEIHPNFHEGLPPGVTGEVDRHSNVLTLYFHVPQTKVDVEIYHNGMLVTKDTREVKPEEKVSYSLPEAEEGQNLVLISGDDGDVYGDNY